MKTAVSIAFFGEDTGHESLLIPLVERLAGEMNVEVETRVLNASGGKPKMLRELSRYIGDIERGRAPLPHILLVAVDGNCQGYVHRKQEVEGKIQSFLETHPEILVTAIPDPHIERWMLVDSKALQKTLRGARVQVPERKCDRVFYKDELLKAVRSSGLRPLFGGMEHAQDIAQLLELEKAPALDQSLNLFLRDLRSRFKLLNL